MEYDLPSLRQDAIERDRELRSTLDKRSGNNLIRGFQMNMGIKAGRHYREMVLNSCAAIRRSYCAAYHLNKENERLRSEHGVKSSIWYRPDESEV